MPNFPQYQNAFLAEYATYRQLTQGTHVSHTANPATPCFANPGDVITNVVVAGDSTAYTVYLPAVTTGGPVIVKVTGVPAPTGNTVTISPLVSDTVAGVLIDGWANVVIANTAGGSNATVTFASDGSNWWIVSKSHSTTETW